MLVGHPGGGQILLGTNLVYVCTIKSYKIKYFQKFQKIKSLSETWLQQLNKFQIK